MAFPGGSEVQNPPASAGDRGDVGSIPWWGRSPGVGDGNPLQYSCLRNPMDRGTWQATVHGVAKSQMRMCMHTHTQIRYIDVSPREDPLEKGKATHSNILACRIPCTVYSSWGHKKSNTSNFHFSPSGSVPMASPE